MRNPCREPASIARRRRRHHREFPADHFSAACSPAGPLSASAFRANVRPPTIRAQLVPANASSFQVFSLFSLFFHQIYSDRDLILRRNPRFWRFGPAKKQRDGCCFFAVSAVFGGTIQPREDDDINCTNLSAAPEAGVTILDP